MPKDIKNKNNKNKNSKPLKKAKVLAVKARKSVDKKSAKIKRKKKHEPEILKLPKEPLFKAKIKVVGIGGGGGSIVSEIGRSLERASFLIADTDTRAIKKKNGIKFMLFGQSFTHGMGTGVNVDLAKKAAEAVKERMAETLKGQDIVIFIASLGGGLGSGATQIFADIAKKQNAITFGIFTLPFKFEGRNKYNIAQNALKSLKQSLNVSFVIPNEKIFKVINESTPITDAFSVVNKSLINSLESLIELIFTPGIINIDFADLRAILTGVGNSAFLNTVEESGKDRAEKICEKIFRNPLAQGNVLKAEKVLFNISGSETLSMMEVEKISRHVSESNPDAKIIFGISKVPKLKNKIKVTILSAGGGVPETVLKPAEEAKKERIQLKAKPAKETVQKEKPAAKQKPSFAKPKIQKPAKKIAKKKPSRPAKVKKVLKPLNIPSVVAGQELKVPIPQFFEHSADFAKAEPAKAIRRTGLEVKEAEHEAEKKRLEQEKEWEIPAFLRKVKFK